MQACQLSMFADAKRIGCTQHLHKACPLCYVSHKLHHQTLLLFAHCMTISAFRTTNRDLSSTNQQCDLELIAVNMTQYKHDQSCTPVEETELGQAQTTIMPPQSRYSKAGLTVLDLKVGKRVISKASRLDLHLQQCTSRCI